MGLSGVFWNQVLFFILLVTAVNKISEDQQELNTVPETDDDELSVLGPLLDVVGHNGHVLEVQGCIYLVHHVQRRRLQKNQGNLSVPSSIHLPNTHKSDIELDALALPPVFQMLWLSWNWNRNEIWLWWQINKKNPDSQKVLVGTVPSLY